MKKTAKHTKRYTARHTAAHTSSAKHTPKHQATPHVIHAGHHQRKHAGKKPASGRMTDAQNSSLVENYNYIAKNIPIEVRIVKTPGEFVLRYEIAIESISETTETILERIRQRLIDQVNFGILDLTQDRESGKIEERFEETIRLLIEKYFPESDVQTRSFLTTYLIQKSLGLGNIEILMADNLLEEIVVNDAREPVWVFHKNHGWLKTNVFLRDEEQTRHYAMTIGRKVGRQITIMEPLLDAHLGTGDRVNATISPVSEGNTLTIRRFSRDPWTITKFLRARTISLPAASLIWMGMQYELSALIAGGTASGKTSTLNCLATFFPPNQRIISIEDTRELQLPSFLHWVPMQTRQPNAEGKGEIAMGDLLVNSLRMRPDRILVGEIRRQREAETLLEAIHTGHSCYATFHANSAQETVDRLSNQPIAIPKSMLPAISMIIMQFRNRRTGARRTFQIAEMLPDGSPNVLQQYDTKKDILTTQNKSKSLNETLTLFTGMTPREIQKDLVEKEKILKYLIDTKTDTVDGVGRVMAEYYTDPDNLRKHVAARKPLSTPFVPRQADAAAVAAQPASPNAPTPPVTAKQASASSHKHRHTARHGTR